MKIQKCTPLLNKQNILDVFRASYLYEMNSFHILEKDSKTYDQNRVRGSFIQEANNIYNAFSSGHTIIIKNLEFFSEEIKVRCKDIGTNIDVHMYLVPPNGSDSFPYHQDDRDVVVHMLYGEKLFSIKKDNNNESLSHTLQMGEELSIPKGTWHKATPKGGSCLLSFGKVSIENYASPSPFSLNDLV